MVDDNSTEEDPNLPGNRWKYLQKRRVVERQEFIDRKLMPDPDARYRLDEAITMKGTCEDMCPELERHEREAKALIDPWEYLGGPNTTLRPRRIDHERAVKAYQRGSGDSTIPSDLRTVQACFRTTKYLWRRVFLGESGLSHTHAFVRDRTRAVRLDLRVQMEEIEGRSITRQCVRFHTLSLHALRHLPGDRFDFGTEAEQIGQTLQSLKQLESPHTLASTPEFLAYYILFHIRNEPPKVSQVKLHSSLVLLFANHFRVSVAANSPAFAKKSLLKVGQDGVALWDEFVAAMESPTQVLLEKHFYEASWTPLHRRAVIFLIGCLLEWHFGTGCVSGLAERRRSVVDGIDPGIKDGEENTGEHDLRIIECDSEDGPSSTAPPLQKANDIVMDFKGKATANAPTDTKMGDAQLNAFAPPFVPTFQSNGHERAAPAPAFAVPTPAPIPTTPFFLGGNTVSTQKPQNTSSFETGSDPFTRAPTPGAANAFFPSRTTSPVPAPNIFRPSGFSAFGPKPAAKPAPTLSVFGNVTSAPAAPTFASTPISFAPSSTDSSQPPHPQPITEDITITPPTPESELPPLRDDPSQTHAPAPPVPSIFVTTASPTPAFAHVPLSFQPVAPKPFISKPAPPPTFISPPTSPTPPSFFSQPKATSSAASPLFAAPASSTPPSLFPQPPKPTPIAPATTSKPPRVPTPPVPPKEVPKPVPTFTPPKTPNRNEVAVQTELVYSILLRTVTVAHVSETVADEFSRRRVLRNVRPAWDSWVLRVRKKRDRQKREEERAREWSKEMEEGRRVRRRLADDYSRRETVAKGEELGKVVLERADRRKKYWERGSFLKTLQQHVEQSLQSEGATSSRTGFPAMWTVHLSTNERFATSAAWMKTKLGVDGESTKSRNYLSVSLSGEAVTSKNDSPGLAIFETTPLETDLSLEDRSHILENDCARLRAVMDGLSPDRHYSTALIVILWGEDTPMPISATALSLGLNSRRISLLHLGGKVKNEDPDEQFRDALDKLQLDIAGERVLTLSVRDLAKHLIDIWSEGLENAIALCRGADHFNWQLAGYVMSSSIALLNIVASIVHQVVATQTQTRYEERKLPPLDGSRFTRESSDGLQALRDYLDGGSFDDDDDAEALKMSLEARKRTIGGEYTGATCSSFAHGMAQILLNRIEGTLTSTDKDQSLRLRIPKTRMNTLDASFKHEVEKMEGDLGVLRRSFAAGAWARDVEQRDVPDHKRSASDGGIPKTNGIRQSNAHHPEPSDQPPLTLEDLGPRALSPTPSSSSPRPSHGLALPKGGATASQSLRPRSQTATSTQSSFNKGGTSGALRNRAKEILAKYKNQGGDISPSPTASPLTNGDLPLPGSLSKSNLAGLDSSDSSGATHPRSSISSIHSFPFGVRKKLSYTDMLQLKTDEVLNSSIRKWGKNSM